MRASETLKAYIKSMETLKTRAYKVSRNERYYTIGYGHYGEDVKPGMTITKERADELFARDLSFTETYCSTIKELNTQGKFDAVVDFCYNAGIANFKASTLFKKIIAGAKTEEIQEQFCRWIYCGGTKLNGLVRRREWEARRWAE